MSERVTLYATAEGVMPSVPPCGLHGVILELRPDSRPGWMDWYCPVCAGEREPVERGNVPISTEATGAILHELRDLPRLCAALERIAAALERAHPEAPTPGNDRKCRACFAALADRYHFCPNCGVEQ